MQRHDTARRSWVSALLITILCCALAFILYRFIGVRDAGGAELSQVIKCDNVRMISPISDGLVYYNSSSLICVDQNAKTRWSYMVGDNAQFSVNKKYATVWEGKNLTMLDLKSGVTSYSGSYGEQILSAKSGTTYTAVLLSPKLNSTLMLMDNDGRPVDSLTLESCLVIDYGFFYDDTLLWIMTLDTNGTAPTCTVNVFKPGKRIVGNVSDAEQLVYRPIFRSNDILCCGDVFLKTYSFYGEEDKSARKLLYGYVVGDVCEGSAQPTIALVPDDQFTGSGNLQDVRVLKGDYDRRFHMPFPCVDICAREKEIVGFSSNGIMMVADLETGAIRSFNLNLSITEVAGFTDGGIAVLRCDNDIALVRYQQ